MWSSPRLRATATRGLSVGQRSSWNDDNSTTSVAPGRATAESAGSMLPPATASTPAAASVSAIQRVVVPLPAVPVTPTSVAGTVRCTHSTSPMTSTPRSRSRSRSGWSIGTPGAAMHTREVLASTDGRGGQPRARAVARSSPSVRTS